MSDSTFPWKSSKYIKDMESASSEIVDILFSNTDSHLLYNFLSGEVFLINNGDKTTVPLSIFSYMLNSNLLKYCPEKFNESKNKSEKYILKDSLRKIMQESALQNM